MFTSSCKLQIINNHLLSTKSVVRYLGVFINSHFKWSDHVKYTAAKAARSLNILRHSLYTCLSSVKAAVYKCIVHPILEYASPVWYLHSSGDIKQLENVQRKAARWVCRSRWNPACKQWSRSSDCCLDQMEWPSLNQRQNYFTISVKYITSCITNQQFLLHGISLQLLDIQIHQP